MLTTVTHWQAKRCLQHNFRQTYNCHTMSGQDRSSTAKSCHIMGMFTTATLCQAKRYLLLPHYIRPRYDCHMTAGKERFTTATQWQARICLQLSHCPTRSCLQLSDFVRLHFSSLLSGPRLRQPNLYDWYKV